MRVIVASFGDAGHAFPAFSLARALDERGHEVLVESWDRWRRAVEDLGIGFAAAQQYSVFPPPGPDTPDGRTAAGAAIALAELMEDFEPAVVVSDILTVAPVLAAEVAGVPRVTLMPHVHPAPGAGMPFFGFGFVAPRTPLGRLGWRAAYPLLAAGLRRGRKERNEMRAKVGLEPEGRGGRNDGLALVATYPQLEYGRAPNGAVITGPMFFETAGERIELPPGDEPLVVIAPSTAQDPQCLMLRAAFEALADEPVHIVATTNRHRPVERIDVPDNATLEVWLSYSEVMPHADVVITHGGHGTIARALHSGAPMVVCPAVGDMAENGARVAWSGTGVMVPRRLVRPRNVRLAVRKVLGEPRFRERAGEIAAWSRKNDGAARGAEAIERYATSRLSPARA